MVQRCPVVDSGEPRLAWFEFIKIAVHVVVSALRVNVSDLARGEVGAEEPDKRFARDKVVVQAVTGARRSVFASIVGDAREDV